MNARTVALVVALAAVVGCDSEAAKQREAEAKRAELKEFFARGDKAFAGMEADADAWHADTQKHVEAMDVESESLRDRRAAELDKSMRALAETDTEK